MDLATIIGIVSAFGLVLVAMLLGGDLGMFIDPASILVVIGGTIGVTLVNYPLRDVLKVIGVTQKVIFDKVEPAAGQPPAG